MAAVKAVRSLSKAVKPYSSIPGPNILPVLGSTLQYRGKGPRSKEEYHLALGDMFKEYGPLVKERLGGKDIVHVFDPEDIKAVYNVEGKWPEVPPLQETTAIYRAQKEMSLGLGNTNGEEWYRLRTNCQQRMLRPKEVSVHLPSVDQVAQQLVKRLQEVSHLNSEVSMLKHEIGRWSIENAARMVFHREMGCLSTDEGIEWGNNLVEANAEIFRLSGDLKLSLPIYKYLPGLCPKWKRLIEAENEFYGHAIKLTEEAIIQLKDLVESGAETIGPHSTHFYILSYLLSRTDLSLKDVTTLCLSMFTDGLSTTTPTVLFNLYCLAVWPQVQKKVTDEVDSVLPPPGHQITAEHIAKLPYLKAFVKETFRLWPNGTEVSRYLEQDMVLSGHNIPAGTHVDLNPSVHFKNPEIFEEPDVHMPERWLRGGSGSSVHPYILTPFGHGTRMCAGRRFAEQDLYVVLARLLQRFTLEYPQGSGMAQMYHTLLWPDRPVRVKFLERR